MTHLTFGASRWLQLRKVMELILRMASLILRMILRMASAARRVCLPAGADHLDSNDGAMYILGISKNYSALDAVGSRYQGVARFRFRRGGPND